MLKNTIVFNNMNTNFFIACKNIFKKYKMILLSNLFNNQVNYTINKTLIKVKLRIKVKIFVSIVKDSFNKFLINNLQNNNICVKNIIKLKYCNNSNDNKNTIIDNTKATKFSKNNNLTKLIEIVSKFTITNTLKLKVQCFILSLEKFNIFFKENK